MKKKQCYDIKAERSVRYYYKKLAVVFISYAMFVKLQVL